MNDFTFYFGFGWEHIMSWDALDHLLFIIALTAVYKFGDWRVIVLITAFTIGHSLTLALSVYDIVSFNSRYVEFFIPVTIILTCVFNFIKKGRGTIWLNYLLAFSFGLVHGMGFANTIRFMLAGDQKLALPLLAFNLGVEAGQVMVIIYILSFSYLVVDKAKLHYKWWRWVLSSIALVISLYMCFTRWPF
jgi:hypothetical protein